MVSPATQTDPHGPSRQFSPEITQVLIAPGAAEILEGIGPVDALGPGKSEGAAQQILGGAVEGATLRASPPFQLLGDERVQFVHGDRLHGAQ
jgi:hypothetical protein